MAGAIRMAKEMGPGHNIVTLLCGIGTRYTEAVQFRLSGQERLAKVGVDRG